MNKTLMCAWLALGLAGCASVGKPVTEAPALPPLPDFAVPYQKEVLPNGLTLIVHEDRKAPIVAVNIWYHVGSKDEAPGKTGFAHLFEHLMFQGSENYRDEYFKPFERVGATMMNGTTWLDRTNYFENVPTTALDLALWMESDRMGHFAGAIDQKLLDEQREVVKNEKRQGENRPYGRVWEWLQRASFPEGHPYRWTTIGSMDDLDAASVDDVKAWFAEHYGAANVTLVLAGDIDFASAKAKAMQYFGDIPAGPPPARRARWIAPRSESTRDVMQDRVANARIHFSWNVPEFGSLEADQLEMVAQLLGGGRSSRLSQRLIQQDQIADSVDASLMPFELAGLFLVDADIKPGVDPAQVERAIEEELQRFIAEGPSDDELERARTSLLSALIQGAELIGGFGGKSDLLATCEVYTGDPGCVATSVERLKAFVPEDLQAVAGRWLAQGDYRLLVTPYPDYQTTASTVDRRSGPPAVAQFPALNFPAIERAQLSNGIPVLFARRPELPMVQMELLFDAGYASDHGIAAGTASMAMAMLGEGPAAFDAIGLAERMDQLGASIGTDAALDTSSVSLTTLASRLGPALDLFAEVVQQPALRESDFSRLQARWLSMIAAERSQPNTLAVRVLPPLMFGKDHPYGTPMTGSGTEASIAALDVAAIRKYGERWLRPDNAQFIVVGDTTLDALLPELEARFGQWQPPAVAMGQKHIAPVAPPSRPRLYLLDRPDAPQSVIIGGLLAPPAATPDELAIEVMNGIIGGSFTSRLNMNLREAKGWSYGVRSSLSAGQAQRLMLISAPVQADRTADALSELLRELRDYTGKAPATADEVDKIVARRVRSLPGSFETSSAVLGQLRRVARLGLPDDEIQTLKARLEALTPAQVDAVADAIIQPGQLTWVVVGDRARIEPALRQLRIGELEILDGATD